MSNEFEHDYDGNSSNTDDFQPEETQELHEKDNEKGLQQLMGENNNDLTIENTYFRLEKTIPGSPHFSQKIHLFSRCELLRPMDPLELLLQDGSVISRTKGTVFKTGQEVFLCPKTRKGAEGKTFILVGVLFSNKANPFLSHVVLLDHEVCSIVTARNDEKPTDTYLPIRVCPLKYVGILPAGKTFHGTPLPNNDTTAMPGTSSKPILERNEHFITAFFEAEKSIINMNQYDFESRLVDGLRPRGGRKGKGERDLNTSDFVPILPLTSVSQQRGTPPSLKTIDTKTPPYMKRLETKVNQLTKKQPTSKASEKSEAKVVILTAQLKHANADLIRKDKEIQRLTDENQRLHSELAMHTANQEQRSKQTKRHSDAAKKKKIIKKTPPPSRHHHSGRAASRSMDHSSSASVSRESSSSRSRSFSSGSHSSTARSSSSSSSHEFYTRRKTPLRKTDKKRKHSTRKHHRKESRKNKKSSHN